MGQGRNLDIFLEFVMLVNRKLQDEEISMKKGKKLVVRSKAEKSIGSVQKINS